jgi:hypothetical protein
VKFHLDYKPQVSGIQIDHHHQILMVGSCFAENIGERLLRQKFKVKINPNGILFNPLSIINCLDSALKNKTFNESLLLERQNLFFSYDHHSSISEENKKAFLKKINTITEETHQSLMSADYLIITFGSAYVFEHTKLKHVVANCHKQDSTLFQKKLLEPEEIIKPFSGFISEIKKRNSRIKIIFTVSPVKYLKDGVEQNNLSKSTLILSVNKLVSQNKDCFYFPAYELVNDDLRDYRFYKEDLAHPNKQAIDYVWKKFAITYFNEKTLELNEYICKLNLVLEHKPMNSHKTEAAKLEEYIEKQKKQIMKLDPTIEF